MRKLVVVWLIALMTVLVTPANAQIYASPGILTPDSPLYPLDIWFDNLRLWLSPSKATTATDIMEERLAEYQATNSQTALNDYMQKLRIAKDSAVDVTTRQIVEQRVTKHLEVLKRVRQKVPDEAKIAIGRAIEESSKVVNVIKSIPRNAVTVQVPASVSVGDNVTVSWKICNPFNTSINSVEVELNIRKAGIPGAVFKKHVEREFQLFIPPGVCRSDTVSAKVPESIWGIPTEGRWIAEVTVRVEPQDVVMFHRTYSINVLPV